MSRLWRTLAAFTSCAALVAIGFQLTIASGYMRQLWQIFRGEFRAAPPALASDSAQVRAAFSVRHTKGPVTDEILDLRTRDALVLLFDTHCAACRSNMPRWLDLVAAVRRSGARWPVYAINLDSGQVDSTARVAAEYWHDIENGVTVVQALQPEVIRSALRENRTPTTLAIHNGRFVAVMPGAVGPWRAAFVMRSMASAR